MFGRHHEEGGPEQSVGSGGEHLDRTGCRTRRCPRGAGGEPDRGAVAATDPVALHDLDRFRPVEGVEVVQQPVGVGGDPQHPLPQGPPEDREVADVASPVGGDLLVGQYGAEPRAPVDRAVGEVRQPVVVDDRLPLGSGEGGPRPTVRGRPPAGGQLVDQLADRPRAVGVGVVPGLEDLREDPLGPPVVRRVGRRDAASLIMGQTQPAQLTPVVGDVGFGGDPGMLPLLHRVLLGGQAERIESQCVQHVPAGHPVVAPVHIGADVAQRMPDVQPVARRVGEHVQQIELRSGRKVWGSSQRTCRVRGLEDPFVVPTVLPVPLDLGREACGVAVRRGVVRYHRFNLTLR